MNLIAENDLINKYINYGVFNTEISTKIDYRNKNSEENINNKSPINQYPEKEFKFHNNNYFKKIFNNSIKKNSLILNDKSKSFSLLEIKKNNKNNENKNKLVLKQTKNLFNNIKYLNIKKLRMKNDIIPLIINNNLNKEILKNKNNFFSIKRNSFILPKSKSLTNFSRKKLSLQKNFSSFKIDFFNDYKNDFFPDVDYSNLEYNEDKIFKDKVSYENLIKEKLEYFKENTNENRTIKLEKKIYYGKHKTEIILTLNSLNLSLEDMSLSPELQNKDLKITFPLALLPIFYYKGIDSFQKILANVIKVGTNFDKIFFDESIIKETLKNIKDYQTEEDEYCDYDFNYLYNLLTNKNEKRAKIFEDKPISLRPLFLQKSKDFLRFSYFIFFWVTNSRNFVSKLSMPCVTLNIKEYKITINHFLDFEFLFFLYKNHFLNWEYYTIKYFSSFSKFREIFQQLGKHNSLSNTIIYLKEPKTKINNFNEEILLNIYTDSFYKNHIILFKSFYVKINFVDDEYIYEKIYNIYFSFFQYIKLYEIGKYSTKIEFLIKFIDIKNDTHTLEFNFKKFEEFDIKEWINNIKKFSEKALLHINNQEENLFQELFIYKKKLNIEFKKPQWSIIKFENNKEITKTWEIGKELEIYLVRSILDHKTENWTRLLNECLKKLDEPVPVIMNIPSPKRTKKKLKYRNRRNSRNSRNSNISNSSSQSSKEKKSRFSDMI